MYGHLRQGTLDPRQNELMREGADAARNSSTSRKTSSKGTQSRPFDCQFPAPVMCVLAFDKKRSLVTSQSQQQRTNHPPYRGFIQHMPRGRESPCPSVKSSVLDVLTSARVRIHVLLAIADPIPFDTVLLRSTFRSMPTIPQTPFISHRYRYASTPPLHTIATGLSPQVMFP